MFRLTLSSINRLRDIALAAEYPIDIPLLISKRRDGFGRLIHSIRWKLLDYDSRKSGETLRGGGVDISAESDEGEITRGGIIRLG